MSLAIPVSFAQGSKRAKEYDSIEDRDRDNPKARDEWFMRGRTVPEGESPAMLRYQAYQQKIQSETLQFSARGGNCSASCGLEWMGLPDNGICCLAGRRDEVRLGCDNDPVAAYAVRKLHHCGDGNRRYLEPEHHGNDDGSVGNEECQHIGSRSDSKVLQWAVPWAPQHTHQISC